LAEIESQLSHNYKLSEESCRILREEVDDIKGRIAWLEQERELIQVRRDIRLLKEETA
jgi:hypothetical protein